MSVKNVYLSMQNVEFRLFYIVFQTCWHINTQYDLLVSNIIQLGNNCGILQNVIVTNHSFILQLSNITLIILYIVLADTLNFNTICYK